MRHLLQFEYQEKICYKSSSLNTVDFMHDEENKITRYVYKKIVETCTSLKSISFMKLGSYYKAANFVKKCVDDGIF